MNYAKFAIVVLMMPILLSSCSKEYDVVLPVEGNWSGFYGNDNNPPAINYNLIIKDGGVIGEANPSGQIKGTGTWNLSGNTFTAHYQWNSPLITVFSLTAIYDPATKRLSGTWGFDKSATDGGKWEVARSN